MRWVSIGIASWVLAACATPAPAAGPIAAPASDVRVWLSTPPDPNPLADEIMKAWIGERDALLSGERAPSLDWHQTVIGYQQTSQESGNPFVQQVYRRIALDQYGRLGGVFTPDSALAIASRLGFDLPSEDAPPLVDRLIRHFIEIDLDNTAFLQRELNARQGKWWTVTEVGKDTANMIWLLTQHADQTPEFQRYALEQMVPLLETGDVNRNNYAYLWDRVAIKDGRPQRFGTQGRCVAPGDWEAFEIEAPVDEVNQRRADFDISMTFEENDDRLDADCA